MCINYVHSDRFLIPWEAFFVQCSYAMPVLLRSVSSHNQTAADGFIGNGVGGAETVRDNRASLAPFDHAGVRYIELLKTLRPAAAGSRAMRKCGRPACPLYAKDGET
ncbi:hypothetical protein [Sinorhizobium medicae]|uniref:hypothetical protein n=1 Tax=Sinorhizobium medicae TaxID=110321 RepID=UPI0013E344E0|nr:hypothetical protein [Sinorhizobium medicae]